MKITLKNTVGIPQKLGFKAMDLKGQKGKKDCEVFFSWNKEE